MKGSASTSPASSTEAAIGETLQKLRLQRGLSLRTFAAAAGFSASFISQVENGQTSPSIASLARLAQALGLGLADFFVRATADPAVVVRAADRGRLISEWSRARLEPMVPHGALNALDGLLVTLASGGRSGKHPTTQAYDQLALVLEGTLDLTLAASRYQLGPGDAAAIPAGQPHLWENRSGSEVRFAVVAARKTT